MMMMMMMMKMNVAIVSEIPQKTKPLFKHVILILFLIITRLCENKNVLHIIKTGFTVIV